MKKRIFAGTIIAIASTGLIPIPSDPKAEAARPPIHWKVGEFQTAQFDARPGDTVSVFFQKRDTPTNIKKCNDMGGFGLILTRWHGRMWEVCYKVDF